MGTNVCIAMMHRLEFQLSHQLIPCVLCKVLMLKQKKHMKHLQNRNFNETSDLLGNIPMFSIFQLSRPPQLSRKSLSFNMFRMFLPYSIVETKTIWHVQKITFCSIFVEPCFHKITFCSIFVEPCFQKINFSDFRQKNYPFPHNPSHERLTLLNAEAPEVRTKTLEE